LFCLTGLTQKRPERTRLLSFSFWAINLGLALMVLLSLLPVGLLQAWASMSHGMWYARSADFMQTDLMQNLRWLRAIGDTVFAAGIVGLVWYVFGLRIAPDHKTAPRPPTRSKTNQRELVEV
jgi:nitric oxide reductase subunit B